MPNIAPTIYDLKECDVILVDGTPITPNELTISIDEGNVTWEVTQNVEYRKNRGVLESTRKGDEEPMSVTFNARFSEITSSSGLDESVFEFLTFSGAASAFLSTGTNECDNPKAIDIKIVRTPSCVPATDVLQTETITFPEFRWESIGGDFGAGQFNVSGKCNVELPTAVRADP